MGEADTIEARLAALGIVLPPAMPAAASYVPAVQWGELVFISGQGPIGPDGVLHPGQVGAEVDLDQARAAARLTAINLMAQFKAACGGDLSRLRRVVKLTGFVAAAPGFRDHPKVVDGASELLAAVFGEAGGHARSAVGVSSLPFGICVEIEAVIAVSANGA